MGEFLYQALWAKSSPFHPLWCHLIDVGAVATILWDEIYPNGWKQHLAQSLFLDLDETRNLVIWLAAVHDIGKASPQFQSLDENLKEKVKNAKLFFPSSINKIPHGDISAEILVPYLKKLGWTKGIASMAARATGGHHGFPPKFTEETWACEPEFGGRPSSMNKCKYTPDSWKSVQIDLIREVLPALGLHDPLQPNSNTAQIAVAFIDIAGFISFSDWIGSANQFFSEKIGGEKANEDSPSEYTQKAYVQARKALESFGWNRLKEIQASRSYSALFPTIVEPRPLQQQVQQILGDHPDTRFLLIEAPMGEGKTEAALFAARHWLQHFNQRGVYLALPTQATSNAMHDRFVQWFGKLGVGDANVLLLHGGFIKPEHYENMKAWSKTQFFEKDPASKNEERDMGSARADEWFLQAKRGLLAPFGVGTIDQALLAVLPCQHHFVRLHGLAGKTIIFDEVHAYDAYTGKLLDLLLEYLRAIDCTVVMLSATLPAKRRAELYQAYTGRTIEAASPYPRILAATNAKNLPAVTFETSPSSSKTVAVDWLPSDLDAALMALSDRLGERGCAAFVFNTVGDAQTAYRRAKELGLFDPAKEELTILHSRFTFGDRQTREENLLKHFGKGNADRPPGRALVVATQVIEQSLDLDFDLMASDIAPIDLLLQRTGRLHRHERPNRPEHLCKPVLLVREPEMGAEGPNYGKSAFVYGPPILMRTHALLTTRNELQVPEQVEALIEAVYGDEGEVILPDAWREKYRSELKDFEKKMRQSRRHADRNSLRSVQTANYWESPPEYTADEIDPEAHADLRPMTREGDETVRALCLHQVDGQLCLDREGSQPINESKPPDRKTLERLLHFVATLPAWYLGAKKSKDGNVIRTPDDLCPVPSAWQRNGILRHLPVIQFKEGRFILSKNRWVVWDEETGIGDEIQKDEQT